MKAAFCIFTAFEIAQMLRDSHDLTFLGRAVTYEFNVNVFDIYELIKL